ncbi:hypothetical protein DAPPUDRAFT_301606 [Daphnia pulex]|uniref:Uncharacterized protein n=1 Tax=Daphnia pulex TaxID=6669 RepID=E9GAB7_DAPPU|nr:hypothetical protein DAPPUDRAFT_301606 [Daphnia pulex]|eukprot:EFX83738.1 hypothetical protein DAPPUDRAFT_301606 [Daphnia pulex]
MAYAVEHQYTRTPVRRFLEVFRDEHQYDRRPCGLTPVHPSKAVPKKKPLHAAGIFPIKPKKAGQSKSCLPVPVRSVESGVRSSKVQAKFTGTTSGKGKSRIPVLSNQFTIHAPKIEALKKREREIMVELLKVRAEREHVESLQRKLLVHKPTPAKTLKRRSKSLALDSPFSLDNDSQNMGNMSPMPLLSPAQSKNPGRIYENYRRTLKFLQTPSRSTFKQRTRSTLQSDNGTNVSQLVQSQLAHLFT